MSIETFMEDNQTIIMTVIAVFCVLVMAGVELEPEDMELYEGPPRLIDVIMVLGLLIGVSLSVKEEPHEKRLGYRIDLGLPVLPRLRRKTRNTVRRSSETLWVRQGTLDELRGLHWDQAYLPLHLADNQHVYVALHKEQPISAILLEEIGNHLVYRYAGNDPDYMSLNGNTYLLWWAAEHWSIKGYKYIDLGGSAKPSIEAYKQRLSTSSYPLQSKPWYSRILAKIKYHLKRRLIELQ